MKEFFYTVTSQKFLVNFSDVAGES